MTTYVWKIRDYTVRPLTVAPQWRGEADTIEDAIAAIKAHWPDVPEFVKEPACYHGQPAALSAGWPTIKSDKTAWVIERNHLDKQG